MSNSPELSMVIPCYNEAENIPLILKRFAEVVSGINAELILVNNGSTDNSQEIIEKELQKPEYSFARTVLVQKNIGYGYGIVYGLKQCQGEIISYSHADLQCDPLDIIRAYNVIKKKINPRLFLIKGQRKERKIVPKVLSSCFQMLATLLFFQNYHEINAQPKVFHRNFLEKLKYPPLDFNLDFYLLYKAKKEKLKIINIWVDFPERQYGESKWAFSHLSKLKTIHNFIRYMIKLKFSGEKKAMGR